MCWLIGAAAILVLFIKANLATDIARLKILNLSV
jgi:hypothetical protein